MASGFLRDGFDRPTLENCTMVRILAHGSQDIATAGEFLSQVSPMLGVYNCALAILPRAGRPATGKMC